MCVVAFHLTEFELFLYDTPRTKEGRETVRKIETSPYFKWTSFTLTFSALYVFVQ